MDRLEIKYLILKSQEEKNNRIDKSTGVSDNTYDLPELLRLYTWNFTTKKIECSLMKLDKNKEIVDINFDNFLENYYKYNGLFLIEDHAIFINTYSEEHKDMCLIILFNEKGFYQDYKNAKCYFNIGIMLSFSRRDSVPESKLIFVIDKDIERYPNLRNLLKSKLKLNKADKSLLKEIIKTIVE